MTNTMPPDFGHWLAGFVDGEGCFVIKRETDLIRYQCSFKLAVRLDDAAVVREICRRTGLGHVYIAKARARTQPSIRWQITNKADCLRLIAVFRTFPLRSKKQRDFELWAQAVEVWVSHKQGDPWTTLAVLHDRLRLVRAFSMNGERLPAPTVQQLALLEAS